MLMILEMILKAADLEDVGFMQHGLFYSNQARMYNYRL